VGCGGPPSGEEEEEKLGEGSVFRVRIGSFTHVRLADWVQGVRDEMCLIMFCLRIADAVVPIKSRQVRDVHVRR
jgi:hypothetical protein